MHTACELRGMPRSPAFCRQTAKPRVILCPTESVMKEHLDIRLASDALPTAWCRARTMSPVGIRSMTFCDGGGRSAPFFFRQGDADALVPHPQRAVFPNRRRGTSCWVHTLSVYPLSIRGGIAFSVLLPEGNGKRLRRRLHKKGGRLESLPPIFDANV